MLVSWVVGWFDGKVGNNIIVWINRLCLLWRISYVSKVSKYYFHHGVLTVYPVYHCNVYLSRIAMN